MDKDIKHLLHAESDQLKQLQSIVTKTIDEEKLIINNLIHPPKETLSSGQKISDKVALFGGSWAFIISFIIILVIWIVYNSLVIQKERFDPYPFILSLIHI